jgi:hypothetical protein
MPSPPMPTHASQSAGASSVTGTRQTPGRGGSSGSSLGIDWRTVKEKVDRALLEQLTGHDVARREKT